MFNAFDKLKASLSKTKDKILGKISEVVLRRKIDEDLLEEIEEILIEADVGVPATMHLIESMREQARQNDRNLRYSIFGEYQFLFYSREEILWREMSNAVYRLRWFHQCNGSKWGRLSVFYQFLR